MCPKKEWFMDLKEFNACKILLSNNNECMVKGIGHIRLKLHDGIERTLNDVRFIPELKRNIIFSRVSYDDVKVEKGKMKVIKGYP